MSDQSETGFKYLFYNSAQPWSDSEQTWHGVREDLKSCTFAEEKEELSFLQLKGEAVLAMSLCVKQYPRVPQGFKFQRDALQRHLSRPGTQPEEKAAAAVEAHHVGIWGSEKKHTLNKVHSCLCLSRHSEEDDTLTLTVMVLLSAALLRVSRPPCHYRSTKLKMSAVMRQLLDAMSLRLYCWRCCWKQHKRQITVKFTSPPLFSSDETKLKLVSSPCHQSEPTDKPAISIFKYSSLVSGFKLQCALVSVLHINGAVSS